MDSGTRSPIEEHPARTSFGAAVRAGKWCCRRCLSWALIAQKPPAVMDLLAETHNKSFPKHWPAPSPDATIFRSKMGPCKIPPCGDSASNFLCCCRRTARHAFAGVAFVPCAGELLFVCLPLTLVPMDWWRVCFRSPHHGTPKTESICLQGAEPERTCQPGHFASFPGSTAAFDVVLETCHGRSVAPSARCAAAPELLAARSGDGSLEPEEAMCRPHKNLAYPGSQC